MADTEVRQVTLRVPEATYARVKKLARTRGRSLNQLAVEQLEKLAEEDRQIQLREAYESLGRDSETEVEVFQRAQREVLKDE